MFMVIYLVRIPWLYYYQHPQAGVACNIHTVYRQETTMVLAGKREYKIEITKTRARQNVTGSIVLLSEPGHATTFENCDNATMYQVF